MVSSEHKADSLIAKSEVEAGGTVREIDAEQSHWRLSPLWLSASSSACHGLLITVITPLPTSRRQNARTGAGERGNYRHADASAWCCCARCKIHGWAKPMLKLKMMPMWWCCRWSSSVAHHSLSVSEATTASGVDNAASPRLADTAERDYFTSERGLITMQKQLEANPEAHNDSADRVAHTGWATHAIIVSNTHALPAEYNVSKQ